MSDVKRKYKFNKHYFDIIDNEHKAYWLGWLYADGCNYIVENKHKYVVSITLQIQDKLILEKFCEDLETDYPISTVSYNGIDRYYCNVTINNKYFSDKLKELGVIERKSLVLKFPTKEQVPIYLIQHFIRGFSDGNGCIEYHERKNYSPSCSFRINSTYDFCLGLKEVILRELDINVNIRPDHSIYTIGCGGRLICQSILEWLYKDATIWLDRKYEKYQLIKNSTNPIHYKTRIKNERNNQN